MRILLQRVSQANVKVEQKVVGEIERGLLLLVGVSPDDNEKIVEQMAAKIVQMRIFEDSEEKMNLSLLDCNGSILSVSQFTLYADCKKGRRPSFTGAAKPDFANSLYEKFNDCLRSHHVKVETGVFGAMMDVSLVNEGPVTIWLDSEEILPKT